ncbi:hypothetical protein SB719_20355, partial [Pantoea sp. SIMBA_079]|uniref:hypothetical protein n=1 Tax=Pantoea sp. SIMBA_079 TaxID=3085817 RepID=UPI0039927AB1
IGKTLGSSSLKQWQPNIVKQYTLKGSLWGVPQLADPGIGLFYNADLLKKAGLSPASLAGLHWSPVLKETAPPPILTKLNALAPGRTAAI